MVQGFLVLLLFLTSTGGLNIGFEIVQIDGAEDPGDLVGCSFDVALPLEGGEGLKDGQMGMACYLRRLFAHNNIL